MSSDQPTRDAALDELARISQEAGEYDLMAEEVKEMFGGEAQPIVRTPEEQAELERLMKYVDREGHQPP